MIKLMLMRKRKFLTVSGQCVFAQYILKSSLFDSSIIVQVFDFIIAKIKKYWKIINRI